MHLAKSRIACTGEIGPSGSTYAYCGNDPLNCSDPSGLEMLQYGPGRSTRAPDMDFRRMPGNVARTAAVGTAVVATVGSAEFGIGIGLARMGLAAGRTGLTYAAAGLGYVGGAIVGITSGVGSRGMAGRRNSQRGFALTPGGGGSSVTRAQPGTLRLPVERHDGADPFKLARQYREYGTSTSGMPTLQVTRDRSGNLVIQDGVTRAARAHQVNPDGTVPVEVIGPYPGNASNYPRVSDRH